MRRIGLIVLAALAGIIGGLALAAILECILERRRRRVTLQ